MRNEWLSFFSQSIFFSFVYLRAALTCHPDKERHHHTVFNHFSYLSFSLTSPLVLNTHHQAVGKSDAEKEKAEARFRDVGEAYEVLSDPTKKQVSIYIYVCVCVCVCGATPLLFFTDLT